MLPTGIKGENAKIYDEVVADRFSKIDVQAAIIYLFELVKSSALDVLADQLDVNGYKGFYFALNDAQKREILKKAIELKRYSGTRYAVREALKQIGYYNVIFNERLQGGIFYNGVYTHNGSQTHNGGHWADFRVMLDVGLNAPISATAAANAVILINLYKGVRNRLIDVSYGMTINETLDLTESVVLNISQVPIYNGQYIHNGLLLYGGVILPAIVNINLDGDLEIVPRDPNTVFSLTASGDLDVSGFEDTRYTIDNNGDLIYT